MRLVVVIMVISLFFIKALAVNANIIANEIMYDPSTAQGGDFFSEWIELYNNGASEINLSGAQVCGDTLLAGYVDNPTGTIFNATTVSLPAYAYALITDGGSGTRVYTNFNVNPSAVALHVNASSLCNGLSNSGENIILVDSVGNTIHSITYSSVAGEGYSAEWNNSEFVSSMLLGGTPGFQNSMLISCIPFLTNTSWSGWANQTSCLVNDTYIQNSSLTQYDQNFCGTVANTSFSRFNYPFCDYCVPIWRPVNTSCLSNDAVIQWHNDSNRCHEQTDLQSDLANRPDNVTYPLRCDYDADGFIGTIADANVSFIAVLEQDAQNSRVKEGNKTIVEFPLLGRTVSFQDLAIRKQSNGSAGYVLVRGWELNMTQTKTIYVDKLNSSSNAVCIKDAEVHSMAEMSAACSGENESIVVCNGELHNGYRCTEGDRFALNGVRHSAVQEFYNPPVPDPDSGSSGNSGGGGGGGGGNSCPLGTRLKQGKCVAVVPVVQAIQEQSGENLPESETVEKNSARVVEKDIEMSFAKAKPISKKPLLTNLPFGNEITGAAVGVPTKSLKVIPLLIIATMVIFGAGVIWVVQGKK